MIGNKISALSDDALVRGRGSGSGFCDTMQGPKGWAAIEKRKLRWRTVGKALASSVVDVV